MCAASLATKSAIGEIAAQWEHYAELYDQRIGDTGDEFHQSIIDPRFLELIGDVSGKRILDAGCGNGYFAAALARRGAVEIVAVDLSSALLGLARHRFRERSITFQRADLSAPWQFPDSTFDLVIAHMTLQYLPDIYHFASEASRVLRHGAVAAVSIDHPAHAAILQTLSISGIPNQKFLSDIPYLEIKYCRKRSLGGNAILGFFHRPLFGYFMPFIESSCIVREFREIVRKTDITNGISAEIPRVALLAMQNQRL